MQTYSAFGYRFFKRLTYNLFILLFMLILRENIIKLILHIIFDFIIRVYFELLRLFSDGQNTIDYNPILKLSNVVA